jgi:uncharacterized LabA/DUF88 family protein
MPDADRLRIAVFIDFDNIEIGVKNTLGSTFDAGVVLEALKERGEVVSKMAYSDWQRAAGHSRQLTQHAIRMVQRNLTPGGDKNGADINLALDALEMAFTHAHINAFVIVGGDSDFISLVEKLKQYDKKVFVVGGRQFTSGILQRNCHEFIAYENLVGAGAGSGTGGGRRQAGRDARLDRAPIEQAIPLVTRALKVLADREVSPQLGLLKTTLLQLDSTFSERSYGAGSFRDFAQKLEKIGVLRVQQSKGGWLVGPAEGRPLAAENGGSPDEAEAAPDVAAAPRPAETRAPSSAPTPAPAVTGTPTDGLRAFREILASAEVRRWPMYLRNVKQMIRQGSPSFDERAFGFANLADLLRAAHKDGAVRVERDRQGVIRVFQANGAAPAPRSASSRVEPPTGDVDGNRADFGAPHEDLDAPDDDAMPVAAAAAEVGVPVMAIEEAADDVGNVADEPAAAAAPRTRRRRPRSTSATPRAPRARKAR